MTKPKRIMVLTLSFGSGHVRAAQEIASEIENKFPETKVRLIDALENCSLPFRAFYVWTYWAMIRCAPRVWEKFFNSRRERGDRQTAPVWVWKKGCKRVFDEIKSFVPDAIVACEVGACEIAVIARRENLTDAEIINVITDFEAEPIWVKPEIGKYAAASSEVRNQLINWGAEASKIEVSGIPVGEKFTRKYDSRRTRARYGISDSKPLVLLMGGGMGPTQMDEVAKQLLKSQTPMHVFAVAGHDKKAKRKLQLLRSTQAVSLTVFGWTRDVPALMQAASVLVTKPGGLTTAEAAVCRAPMILFDAIPGPELRNAQKFTDDGAAISSKGSSATANAVIALLNDENRRAEMKRNLAKLAKPRATEEIVELIFRDKNKSPQTVLILTIGNGAGHIRSGEAVAAEIEKRAAHLAVKVIDVADFMNSATRFTHLTLYLWLVKHAPRLWDKIDRYQKSRTQTSPEWFYRRGCRKIFDLARAVQPCALVATEVGCAEIAALVKRDLKLGAPLVAVNAEYDADRAWVQPEIDFYSVPTVAAREELIRHGAKSGRVKILGAPVAAEFSEIIDRRAARESVCRKFKLDGNKPIILIAGGSEGLGEIEKIARRLLGQTEIDWQLIVLCGRNAKLKEKCERLAQIHANLRVVGWTSEIAKLMRAADLLISKLGNTFDEALASGLPIVALEPPPGSERIQYKLLGEWNVGRAVRNLDELEKAVTTLMQNPSELEALRKSAVAKANPHAARKIAGWLCERLSAETDEVVFGQVSEGLELKRFEAAQTR